MIGDIMRMLFAGCLISILLGGCWSASDVEGKSYVTALAVDYEDGQFIVYTQMLDFTNITKSESGGKPADQSSNFLGRGTGRTLNLATDDLYRTSQMTVTWGHISAILFSERAFKAQGFKLIDMINRFPEIRYNTWLYVTKEPLEELLQTSSLFNLSSLYSILHEPMPNYKQYSFIRPVLLFKYIAAHNELDRTAYIPSLTVNHSQFREQNKGISLPAIDGAYFESATGVETFFSRDKLGGYHWMQPSMERAPLAVMKDGIAYANLSLGRPKIKIKPSVVDGETKFRISISLLAGMYEYNESLPYQELVDMAEAEISKQVMDVYREGLKRNVDIFNLGYRLRQHDPKAWTTLSEHGRKLVIGPDSIDSLEVKVSIPYNGKYKRIASKPESDQIDQ